MAPLKCKVGGRYFVRGWIDASVSFLEKHYSDEAMKNKQFGVLIPMRCEP